LIRFVVATTDLAYLLSSSICPNTAAFAFKTCTQFVHSELHSKISDSSLPQFVSGACPPCRFRPHPVRACRRMSHKQHAREHTFSLQEPFAHKPRRRYRSDKHILHVGKGKLLCDGCDVAHELACVVDIISAPAQQVHDPILSKARGHHFVRPPFRAPISTLSQLSLSPKLSLLKSGGVLCPPDDDEMRPKEGFCIPISQNNSRIRPTCGTASSQLLRFTAPSTQSSE